MHQSLQGASFHLNHIITAATELPSESVEQVVTADLKLQDTILNLAENVSAINTSFGTEQSSFLIGDSVCCRTPVSERLVHVAASLGDAEQTAPPIPSLRVFLRLYVAIRLVFIRLSFASGKCAISPPLFPPIFLPLHFSAKIAACFAPSKSTTKIILSLVQPKTSDTISGPF